MIGNKLTLYCTEYEQAMLWEACRHRNCEKVKSCLYRRLVEHFGDNLCTPTPIRVTSVADAETKLTLLTGPMPVTRTPMMGMGMGISAPAQRKKVAVKVPTPTVKAMLPMDMLREKISAEAKNSH